MNEKKNYEINNLFKNDKKTDKNNEKEEENNDLNEDLFFLKFQKQKKINEWICYMSAFLVYLSSGLYFK